MLLIIRFCGISILVACCLTVAAYAQQPQESPATFQVVSQSKVQAQQAAAQQIPAKTQAMQDGRNSDEEQGAYIQYARMLLVVFVLLVLGYLFWVMIVYSNRIAQTGPLGIQIVDALNEVRRQRVMKSLGEKWDAGEYHKEVLSDQVWMSEHASPAIPDELEGDWASRDARRQLRQRGRIGTLPPGYEDEPEQIKKLSESYLATLRGLEEIYDAEARRRFAEEQRTLLAPQMRADKSIIRYFDFPSVAGQGPEFVLRFTALVTIIFAVIALSILGLLDPDQAGTILAAIAGYVLGQASARTGRGGGDDSTQTKITRKSEP